MVTGKGEETNYMYKLEPGNIITNAIDWEGKDAEHPDQFRAKSSDPVLKDEARSENWIAFKDEKGRIGFIAKLPQYLKEVNPK